jgi:cytochrome c
MGSKVYAVLAVLAVLALSAGAANAQAIDAAMGGAGDAAHGQVLFKQRCSICHQPDKGGKNGVGPALYGAYGHVAGSNAAGFAYTDKLKASGIVWTPEKLNQWIQKPASLVPGVKMVLAPVTSAQDRADIIAFLKTESDVKAGAPTKSKRHEEHEAREHGKGRKAN